MIEYFCALALRHHFRFCMHGPGAGNEGIDRNCCGNVSFSNMFSAFTWLFFFMWPGFVFTAIGLSSPLLDEQYRYLVVANKDCLAIP